jgi:hypothetical protein
VTIHGPLALNLILATWGMGYLGVRASGSPQKTLDPGLRRGDDSWATGSQQTTLDSGLRWGDDSWATGFQSVIPAQAGIQCLSCSFQLPYAAFADARKS